MKKRFTLIVFGFFLLFQVNLSAQQQIKLDFALHHFDQQLDKWDLTAFDIAGMEVSDHYVSQHNKVSHFYFNQQYNNIPVYNAISGIHLTQNGDLGYATNRFVSNLVSKINTTTPQISASDALETILTDLDLTPQRALSLLSQSGNEYIFSGSDIVNTDIVVKLVYLPIQDSDEVRLCWDVSLDLASNPDYWSIRVDAENKEILDRLNWTIYCSFDHDHSHSATDACSYEKPKAPAAAPLDVEMTTVSDGASYRVFPVPLESPIHGDRELIVNPADVNASPFGWHDTNEEAGHEYTITRGNNVHAYLDEADNNSSAGDEPDGTDELVFDYYFDILDEPENMKEAAITQLFYMNNMIHDRLYYYGFDEAAGNFQQRNYTGEGAGGDYVLAEGQDGSGVNNANFSTPADGGNGRMQMYLWNGAGGRLLTVLDPEQISGGYETGTADYGAPVSDVPLIAPIVDAYDGTNNSSLGCETIINGDEVMGNIAMVDRGTCFFEQKTANAEAAGAIALIICNYEENAQGMTGTNEVDDPNITTISLKASDCVTIRNILAQDIVVNARIVIPDDSGASSVDADFDNGIMAHEYGHGISNRLTGGPGAAGCLGNDEQMGEGWSDFFTLIMTVKPTDTGDMGRGIGNYAARNDVNGGGIRRAPYSTDFAINDQVYDDIIGTTAPHPLGEVWVSMIWDLYWAFVDEYGYEEDFTLATGGNNIAIQLVMDGMKMQPCSPGLQDGRDAILGADFLNNDGANQCLIWEVFARRGLGVNADQGSSNNRNDGRQNFEHLPECIKELKIVKTADVDLIEAGDMITVELTVTNHKEEAATGVTVHDIIPDGLSYVAGSATGAAVTDGGSSLTFDIGTLDAGDDIDITYELSSDQNMTSLSLFSDDIENGDTNWDIEAPEGFDIWDISMNNPNSGDWSWYIPNTANENEQILVTANPITISGDNPAVRFYHSYNTQHGVDGGIVQVSTDGFNWDYLDNSFIRNTYRGQLSYNTFTVPFLGGFWGNSDGYVDSYIDLSAYAGQDVLIRFRFGSDDATAGAGWYVDDIEVLDMLSYNGEACVSSTEGDMACAELGKGGVIVQPDPINDVNDPIRDPSVLKVYPNPAHDFLNLSLKGEFTGNVEIQLMNTSGVVVKELNTSAQSIIPVSIAGLPAGFYVVQVNTENGIFIEKVTVQ